MTTQHAGDEATTDDAEAVRLTHAEKEVLRPVLSRYAQWPSAHDGPVFEAVEDILTARASTAQDEAACPGCLDKANPERRRKIGGAYRAAAAHECAQDEAGEVERLRAQVAAVEAFCVALEAEDDYVRSWKCARQLRAALGQATGSET